MLAANPRAPAIAVFRQLLRACRRLALGIVALQLGVAGVLLALPLFAGGVVHALQSQQVPGRLMLAWLLVLCVGAALEYGNGLLTARLEARVADELGCRLHEHLQSLPLQWHHERKRGEVLAMLVNDVWRVSGFLVGALLPALPLGLTCVAALAAIGWLEPWVGLALAFSVPLFIVLVRGLARRLRPLEVQRLDAEGAKFAAAERSLSLLPMIKAFARERQETERFEGYSRAARELELRQRRLQAILAPTVRLLATAGVLALLWFCAWRMAAGQMGAATLVTLLLYGLLLAQPASQLAGLWGQWQHARGAMERLQAVFEQAPEPDEGRRELSAVRGELQFEGVRFSYPGRPKLFENLAWQVRAGETVAVTGVNGGGKSTLAHLLMRFADPEAGRVLLDGVDLRELRLGNLRSQVGLVSQHVLLLNGTIAENIGFGVTDASQADIEAAARAAHAHEFISRLPQGYATFVGDDGMRLSGGQRQRLSLARALLRNPRLLFLDEATAMFDPESERDFIAECHALLHDRTVVLVTHRPTSLALADRVFRLEGGRMHELAPASAS